MPACVHVPAAGTGGLHAVRCRLDPRLPADLGVGGGLPVAVAAVARSGSEHGYDVVDFTTIDPARGGATGWARCSSPRCGADRCRSSWTSCPTTPASLTPSENTAWWDVLRLGRDSRYARWFDIDWTCGRIRLPVLGDDSDARAALRVVDGELHYYEHRFPIAPGTGPRPGETRQRPCTIGSTTSW